MAATASSSSYNSKTDAILSRYRPIAPKPPLVEGPPTPENTQQSPFSKNNPSYIVPKPCRNRKRGSKSGYLPSKKAKTPPQLGLFSHGFPPLAARGEKALTLVTLPYLPYPSSSSHKSQVPQEMDLLQCLLHATEIAPPPPSHTFKSFGNGGIAANVISPQAIRPVGSSISVECIQENPKCDSPTNCVLKRAEEVEAEIELDKLPTIVSDSSNRVRLANSAYMEMVGQPECMWLDSMNGACKRIGGKVMLEFTDSVIPVSSYDGFTCRVKIEWGTSAQGKSSVTAHCDVMKLSCQSKDYLFTWRFHTKA
ncbi:hypothetical protein ACHQM5_024865 [Ranunculus cassubicifolius]